MSKLKYKPKRHSIYLNDIHSKIGNHKIGYNTLIFSMGSATYCPSKALNLCNIAKQCYCLHTERIFPSSIIYRENQKQFWLNHSYKELAQLFIPYIKEYSIKYIRINESGDFINQSCVEKLKKFALLLPKRVKIYTYTHRTDLIFSNLPNNLIINGSNFMLDNEYKTIDKDKWLPFTETDQIKVCKNNCMNCSYCKIKGNYTILQKMH